MISQLSPMMTTNLAVLSMASLAAAQAPSAGSLNLLPLGSSSSLTSKPLAPSTTSLAGGAGLTPWWASGETITLEQAAMIDWGQPFTSMWSTQSTCSFYLSCTDCAAVSGCSWGDSTCKTSSSCFINCASSADECPSSLYGSPFDFGPRGVPLPFDFGPRGVPPPSDFGTLGGGSLPEANCQTCPSGFNDGCNSCSCNEYGDAMCTLMACFGSQEAPKCLDSDEEYCRYSPAPGCPSGSPPDPRGGSNLPPVSCQTCPSGYNDGCNTCSCDYGMGMCTEMACFVQNAPKCLNTDEEYCRNNPAPGCPSGMPDLEMLFDRRDDAAVKGNNDWDIGVVSSREACLRACADKPECRSVDFHRSSRRCTLSKAVSPVVSAAGWSLYIKETAACDIICTSQYDPVCGSDGKTYGNSCALSRATCESGVTLAYRGECSRSNCPVTACPMNYAPVCGSDGKTYGNQCALSAAACESGVRFAYQGECATRPSPCDIICTLQYDPVCGSDGQTYGNSCELSRATCESGVTLASRGECYSYADCSFESTRVAHGQSYTSSTGKTCVCDNGKFGSCTVMSNTLNPCQPRPQSCRECISASPLCTWSTMVSTGKAACIHIDDLGFRAPGTSVQSRQCSAPGNTCQDVPGWIDNVYGVPPYVGCRDIALEPQYCRAMSSVPTSYTLEVQRGCPATCGLCTTDTRTCPSDRVCDSYDGGRQCCSGGEVCTMRGCVVMGPLQCRYESDCPAGYTCPLSMVMEVRDCVRHQYEGEPCGSFTGSQVCAEGLTCDQSQSYGLEYGRGICRAFCQGFYPDPCAYPEGAPERPPAPVMGRPFTLATGEQLLADMAANSSETAWCVDPAAASSPTLGSGSSALASFASASQYKDAAERWAQDGRAEHASVASFSRFSLQLMAVAAPPDLLEASHLAAVDEIKHAKLCFGLSHAFATASGDASAVAPGAFQIPPGSVDVANDVGELAFSTTFEGCVGETVSTVQALFELRALGGLAAVGVPGVEEALSAIFHDEARHAGLAWRTVEWALGKGSPDPSLARARVQAAVVALKKELSQSAPADEEEEKSLAAPAFAGAELPASTKKALRAMTLRYLVVPGLGALLEGKSLAAAEVPKDAPSAVRATFEEMQAPRPV